MPNEYVFIQKNGLRRKNGLIEIAAFQFSQKGTKTNVLLLKALATQGCVVKTHAELSKSRKYRYALWRTWDDSKKKVMFIGLNPATADENEGDHTITRCISYAQQWGYGSIVVGNLFAFRTPSPEEMKLAREPIGQDNDLWLLRLEKEADLVVAMWGNHGSFLNRDSKVKELLPKLKCFCITGTGQPHHTRGLPNGINPIPYIG